MRNLRARWLPAAMVLLRACAAPLHVAAAPLEEAHAYLRSGADFDNGTAHLFLHNTGDSPIGIDSLRIDGIGADAQPDWQALADRELEPADRGDATCLWWLAVPNPVPAGGYCDLAVRLKERPRCRQRLEVACSDGSTIRHEFSRLNDGLSLAFVGFSPPLDTVYLYVEDLMPTPAAIRHVWINGREVTSRARILWPTVLPQAKTCIVVPLQEKLQPGQSVFVKVAGDTDMAVCAGQVRAFSLFPITWMDGSLPDGLDGQDDAVVPYRPGTVPKEGLRGIETIMRCPAHAHGPRARAAQQFIRLYSQLLKCEPQIPSLLYVCRWEKETGYFDFCELGDLIRVMPFARSASYIRQPLEHYEQWLMAMATRAAAPRPVHAEVPIRFADSCDWKRPCTSQEVQALVYLALSRGAKGLSYGERREGINPDAEQALQAVTRQLVAMRPYLQFADYLPLGRTDSPAVEAATLLAGDQAMVVLVINHQLNDFSETQPLRCTPQDNLAVTVSLPPGLSVRSVRDVAAADKPVDWRQAASRLSIRVDHVDIVRPYLVLFTPAQAPSPATQGQR